MRSIGIQFFIVGVLAVLMAIPMLFISGLAQDRKYASERVISEVGQEWGGSQALYGPFLVIPVEEIVSIRETEDVVDPTSGIVQRDENGEKIQRLVVKEGIQRSEMLYFLPKDLEITAQSKNQTLNRGIYEIPVFNADIDFNFGFDLSSAESHIGASETILWDKAKIVLKLRTNRSLRGQATLAADGQIFALSPQQTSRSEYELRSYQSDIGSGIEAEIGDPRSWNTWSLNLEMNGAESLSFAALGFNTHAILSSDWSDPSFGGMFLPTHRSISDEGFTAEWSIPHLARTVAQVGRGDAYLSYFGQTFFGVDFFKPNSFYKKAYSASQYALLFIGLTFLTVLLITSGQKDRVHPVQYLLIGMAKAIFVILMLAYSEHLGFEIAFLISSIATISLLTFYGWSGLKMGRRTPALFALLVLIYVIQFLILQSRDFALLAGGTLAFFALSAAMYFTRNEQWFHPQDADGQRRWFARPIKDEAASSKST